MRNRSRCGSGTRRSPRSWNRSFFERLQKTRASVSEPPMNSRRICVASREQMRREAMAPPVDLQPTPAGDVTPADPGPAESADVASVDVAAPARELATPLAETVAAAEVIQPPPPMVEPVPAPAAFAPPPVPPTAPQYPTAPVVAAMPVTPVRPQARPATPSRTNPRKRRLMTFAMGAAMALSMVGVIVVRQNMAAPGGSQKPAAQTPAAKQIAAPAVGEAAKPTPFVAPEAPAQPVPQEAPPQPIGRTDSAHPGKAVVGGG